MLGDLIRFYRKNLGYTRDEFARRVGVSGAAVTKWEQGDADPSSQTFAKIARVLHVTADELLTLAEESETEPTQLSAQAVMVNKAFITQAFEGFGILNQDGSVDAEQLALVTGIVRGLKDFYQKGKFDPANKLPIERGGP